MMNVAFDGAEEIRKPESMTDEQCSSVWAYRASDDDGFPFFLTAWMPSKEDLEALNAGRPLFLKTIGGRFQPVAMFTLNEHNEVN